LARPLNRLSSGGRWFRGTAVHGDIDIIPANTPTRWEMLEEETDELLLSLPKSLLDNTVLDTGNRVELTNRHQIRDSELETLCWSIQREMEAGYPSGRLYLDGLGLAVASRLVMRHSSLGNTPTAPNGVLSGHRLKQVLAFIEDRLGEDLSLDQIASVAGLSSSHTRMLFRHAMHVPLHQFIIQRRVELGRSLLLHSSLSLAEIAQTVGFAHQSHMARHMRRILGVTPGDLRRTR
jgi:AraC family transcriptional regulator